MSPKCWLLAAAVLISSCDVFEPDHETVLGTVFFHSNPVAVNIPDTVTAGTPFTVTIRTFGDGCYSFARTEIEFDDREAEIRPYDFRKTEGACADIFLAIDHSVVLQFGSQGAATVRVVGLRLPGATDDVIEKTVVVVR
jgi:hypothetical protein